MVALAAEKSAAAVMMIMVPIVAVLVLRLAFVPAAAGHVRHRALDDFVQLAAVEPHAAALGRR